MLNVFPSTRLARTCLPEIVSLLILCAFSLGGVLVLVFCFALLCVVLSSIIFLPFSGSFLLYFRQLYWLERIEIVSLLVVYVWAAAIIFPMNSLYIFVSIIVMFSAIVLCIMVSERMSPRGRRKGKRRNKQNERAVTNFWS